jgi:hypothetical protein
MALFVKHIKSPFLRHVCTVAKAKSLLFLHGNGAPLFVDVLYLPFSSWLFKLNICLNIILIGNGKFYIVGKVLGFMHTG